MKRTVRKTVSYAFLIIMFFLFTFPFFYMFVLATWRTPYTLPPQLWFGPELQENIAALIRNDSINFPVNYMTSVGIAVIGTTLTVFFCTMGGFAFAKYDFRGKKTIFGLMVLTLAIPGFLNIIPFFKMMVFFRWYNTWLPLIVPGMANAFGIFLMTQFLEEAVPGDLLDAARIDGVSELGLLRRVVFPLAGPGIAVLGTVSFIGSWNNFLGALVMLPDPRRSTLPVALSSLFVAVRGNYGEMLAGNALAVLPLLVAFLLFSKKIIANLTAGSLKG